MASDWIKMRVWLRRDPKVIRMADTLATRRRFINWVTDPVRVTCDVTVYEHITSDVTRALCVTGLLEVWGTAREQGDREGDDLVLEHCDLDTLDDVAGIPCFGEAMGAVGWAEEREDGALVFPKFFADKLSPEQRHGIGSAERQARYRQRQREKRASLQASPRYAGGVTSDVTSDVTVTPQRREEKSKEEEPLAREKGVPTPEQEQGDGVCPAAWLLREWFHYYRGPVKGNFHEEVAKMIDELLRHGLLPEQISAEIKRSDRNRTEWPSAFSSRLLKQKSAVLAGSKKPPGDYKAQLEAKILNALGEGGGG